MPRSSEDDRMSGAQTVLATRIARFCYLKTFASDQEAVLETEESLIDIAASQFRESLLASGEAIGPRRRAIEAALRASIGRCLVARSPDPEALELMRSTAEGLDLSVLLPRG